MRQYVKLVKQTKAYNYVIILVSITLIFYSEA